jgi:hypothetical protein
MGTPKNPTPGDLHQDASDIAVVDHSTEHLNTLTKLRAGHEKAVANIRNATPAQLKAAGISLEEAADFVQLAAEHQHICVHHEASAKMTELLHDTKLDKGHKIATRLAEMAEQARRRADRSPNGTEILGPFADLFEYQLGPALKGASTRAKAKAKAPPTKVGDENPTNG